MSPAKAKPLSQFREATAEAKTILSWAQPGRALGTVPWSPRGTTCPQRDGAESGATGTGADPGVSS